MLNIFVITLATLSVSYTISRAFIFEWFRNYLLNKGFYFLYELFSCTYCISNWIALALTILYRPNLIKLFWLVDIFVESSVVVGLVLLLLKILDWKENENSI
jgi:hypothetical protein